MIVHRFPQGSEQWEQIRKGKATASEFSRIITPAKLQFAASAKTYAAEKVAEILGVESPPPPPSYWMDRGTELEQYARNEFAESTGRSVHEVGFVMPSEDSRFGASVDGLVDDEAILEIKCPKAEELILWHDFGVIPRDYVLQIQGGLLATGLSKAFFIGWHPEIEPLILEAHRDEKIIEKLEDGLQKFTVMVDSLLFKIKRRTAARLQTAYQAEEVSF
jgi:predicted phage-related endonuclease